MAAFHWSDEAVEACERIAAARLTFKQIAEECYVTPKTLYNWRHHPEFAARVQELIADRKAEARRLGIADQDARLESINAAHEAITAIRTARANDATIKAMPGGATGFIAAGPMGRPTFDIRLLKAQLLLWQAAATETGQARAKAERSDVDIDDAVKRTQDAGASYVDPGDEDDHGDETNAGTPQPAR